MTKYVLDTNLYINATRNQDGNTELEEFFWDATPSVYLHSVVAAELLAGAIDPAQERRIQRAYLTDLEAAGRVVTPSHRAWKRAGAIITQLVRARKLSPNGIPRSFLNDCVIAASAREHGFTLITANTRDFDLIRSVESVSVVPSWPESS